MSDSNVSMGIWAASVGDFKRAATYLTAAVQAEPNNEEAWFLLGHCLDDPARCRACYQRVLELNPSNDLARISLSRLELAWSTQLTKTVGLPISNTVSPDLSRREGNLWLRWVLITCLLLIALPIALFAWQGDSLIGFVSPTLESSTPLPGSVITPPQPNLIIPAEAAPGTELPHSITLYDGTVITSESGFIMGKDGAIITPGPTQPTDEDATRALELMKSHDYAGAIKVWNKVILLAPQNDSAFYQRALCYYALANGQNNEDAYLSALYSAASDLQQAIVLQPGKLDYILLRREIITAYAYPQDLRADRALLFELAAADGRQALTQTMPFAQTLYIKRQTAENLIEAGRCQDGLNLLQEVAAQTPTGDEFYGGVLMIQSKGEACLGHLDLALQKIDASTFNGSSLDTKAYLKALYLYQIGRSTEAQQVINQTIQQTPAYSGWRYYLRAVLLAEAGKTDAANQDLNTGAMYTWDRNGLYSYAHAKLALAAGDQANGISWLQHAEASLMTDASPLRQRIVDELAALGAQPLQVTPRKDFPGLDGFTVAH